MKPVALEETCLSVPKLTNEQGAQIVELAQEVLSGNKAKQNYDRTPAEKCCVCAAKRHQVRWGELRRPKRTQVQKTRGSVCYCCVRAALALGTGCRSVEVFKKVQGAMGVLRARSEMERVNLGDTDVCECHECLATCDDKDN